VEGARVVNGREQQQLVDVLVDLVVGQRLVGPMAIHDRGRREGHQVRRLRRGGVLKVMKKKKKMSTHPGCT
jgi:hypothetical protein